MRPALLLRGIALAAALAVASLSAAAVARASGPESTGSHALAIPVSWLELANSPCRHQGLEVHFAFQFHGRPERWQPGPTRFGPGTFAALSGWADEQYPWIPEEFDNPAVRLYVRRGSEPERSFASALPHQRFEVTGIVREVWRDRPWIELTGATLLEDQIGEATVFHAARAIELMEAGTFVMADEALQQALSAPLPDAARDELARLREVCATEMADPQPAPIRPRK